MVTFIGGRNRTSSRNLVAKVDVNPIFIRLPPRRAIFNPQKSIDVWILVQCLNMLLGSINTINVWETHANLHTWNCFACCELSDWPKRVITVFIILLYIHEVRSLACDTEQDFLRFPMTQHIAKNRASEKSEFKSNALSKRLVCSYFSLVN